MNNFSQDKLPLIPGVENWPESVPVSKEKKDVKTQIESLPDNLGKAWKDCKVPDFSDPNRPQTCLEVDFPIAQINALSQLEGNAGKPIYQMSKWFARRRSSVFRSLLLSAATECPADTTEAAKVIWDHYYCNHQKAGAYKDLKVLDPFMGGGTTLVEGARLGMQMTGIDLNPVAWFVCKNELAGSDPKQVEELFKEIEAEVKPQIQPFYTTTCPRGHQGHWIDVRTNEIAHVEPAAMAPVERKNYRWEGPEIIYTFWGKHGQCNALGCNHRTPLFKSLIMAQKEMTVQYIELTCPHCGEVFHAELGEARMAPDADFLCTDDDAIPFSTLSQHYANLLTDYERGTADERNSRWLELQKLTPEEVGLACPHCHEFSGKIMQQILEKHQKLRLPLCKKKDFNIQKKKVKLWLLVSPLWAKGTNGKDENGQEYGGYAGATAEMTSAWNLKRLENLELIEIRSANEPQSFFWKGQTYMTNGTMPKDGTFVCQHCGKEERVVDTEKISEHIAPTSIYAFQCYCPACEAAGYNYNGRYFKAAEIHEINNLNIAEHEWNKHKKHDLAHFWPQNKIYYSHMTHIRNPLPDHGYTHWWHMFNSRQLLVHSLLLKTIMNAFDKGQPLDVCEQALGAFQQYLRNQNMYCIWNINADKLEPMMANANYNPKTTTIENGIFSTLGRGNWLSSANKCIEGIQWYHTPWESFLAFHKSESHQINDSLISVSNVYCGSSTDMSMLESSDYDLVITDPPFGDNLYYADMADFFYVWLRIPMLKWYEGQPEAEYFKPERTPHSTEAIDNEVEHPDDREPYEKDLYVTAANLPVLRQLTGDNTLEVKMQNPLYRVRPANEFYSQTLAACWSEAANHLKDGGLMAFTFHHNDDSAWIDVLKALFEAGFYLVATYPIRSDETKGDKGAFGSKKIEYDIIHVCRKLLSEPETVSYAKMRKFVREETERLKTLLENSHGKDLSEADLRVILRGKSLEFYSRHYGHVQTGTGEMLDVRDALLGINQLLDDLLEDAAKTGGIRPPESAEPISRLYLRVFRNITSTNRDTLHKTLQGSGISQNDLESRGWIKVVGRDVTVVPLSERYQTLSRRGLNRKAIKNDVDQCMYLMGMIEAGRNLGHELEKNTLGIKLKPSVFDILDWFAKTSDDMYTRQYASSALIILRQFEQQKKAKKLEEDRQLYFDLFEEEDN